MICENNLMYHRKYAPVLLEACAETARRCNAHLLRASVSLGGSPGICGASMIVTPKDKYYKPPGFGNPPAPHYEYIEFGRNP